jgi:hypothetical protein
MIEQLRLPFASVMPAANKSDKPPPDGDFLSMMDAEAQTDQQDDPAETLAVLVQMLCPSTPPPPPETKAVPLEVSDPQLDTDSAGLLKASSMILTALGPLEQGEVAQISFDLRALPVAPDHTEAWVGMILSKINAGSDVPQPVQAAAKTRLDAPRVAPEISALGHQLPQRATLSEQTAVAEAPLVQPDTAPIQTATVLPEARWVRARPAMAEVASDATGEAMINPSKSPKRDQDTTGAQVVVRPSDAGLASENRTEGAQIPALVVVRQDGPAKASLPDRYSSHKKADRAVEAIADPHAIAAKAGDHTGLAAPAMDVTPETHDLPSAQIAIGDNDGAKPLPLTDTASNASPGTSRPQLAAPANLHSQLLHQAPAAIERQVEVLLSPEELGRVKFQIRHHGETVTVMLSAERPETMDILRRYSSDLIREFREAGFSGASIDFGRWGQQSQPQHQSPASFALSEDFVPTDPVARPIAAPTPRPDAHGLNIRL